MSDSPPTPDDPLVGTVLAGRYRILRKLGEGAMGAVYLGEHLRFGRKDAIKVIRAGMSRDPEAKKRFLRGARNASAISHTNVCTVYDFADTDDGIQFLAMEFVEGETLAETLEREGHLPVGRAVSVVVQTAAALDAAHDLGIVHRDLKPGNIMLARARDGSDLVKVVDFDIAKGSAEGEGGEVTRMGFVVGTPEYMSPEQLTGDPLDGRSDLYSLGVVLFRCLTGALPVRSTSTQDLMVERLTQDPRSLAEARPGLPFPPGLQEVLDRVLARRREDRYPDADAFVADLRRIAGSGSATAAAGGPTRGGGRRPPAVAESPGTGGGGEVPPTRVAPGAGGRDGEGSTSSLPRFALAGGGALVVAAAVAGWAILADGAPSPGGTAAPDPRPDTVRVAQEEEPEEEVVRDSTPGISGDPVTEDPSDPGGPVDEPPPDTDPPVEDSMIPEVSTTPAWLRSSEEAREVLRRQLDVLVAGAGPGRIRAMADTGRMVWDASLGEVERGLGAYLIAEARLTLGDTADAVTWLRRATEADAGNRGFRSRLQELSGGGR